MAINFPSSLDSFPNPTSTDLLENATAALDHDVQHSNANDAIEALEAKVGINGSAVNTSHDYKLSEVSTGDKAVSKTATQTLTNKTLTSPQINFGSDANGDLIYRNGSGVTTRLAIGTTDQILAVQSGLPTWIANPSATDASYTVKGIIKFDTDAATSGVTVTSGVATLNTGTTANKIVKLDASAKLPAVDGSQLTNIANPITYKSGTTTKNAADASTTQTIAHGLGKTPKRVRISAKCNNGGASANDVNSYTADTTYNGTTQSSVSTYGQSSSPYATTATTFSLNASQSNGDQTGVLTFDSTNITITWTKTSSPSGTYSMMWEAEA